MRRYGLVLVLALAPGLTSGAAPGPDEPLDARTALLEGNRQFRAGRLEAAVATYRRGTAAGTADALLAYNLGTTLHRLGRLPEALLWYRRARAAGSRDPWLDENLEAVRADLASTERRPPALLAPVLLHPWLADAVAAALAWAGLVCALLAPPRWRRAAVPLLAAALLSWGGARLLLRIGPRPAVLLGACGPALPAGSEVWGVTGAMGELRVTGGPEVCPPETVALIDDPNG